MKATLVKDDGCVRYYHLSKPITKGKCDLFGEFEIAKEEAKQIDRFKEEFRPLAEQYLANPEGIEYVAVSDAITNIERLVFPAFPVDGGYAFIGGNIAGKHTMMIEGGNPRSVYDDEVYLRYLCRLNGMSWEGLEK